MRHFDQVETLESQAVGVVNSAAYRPPCRFLVILCIGPFPKACPFFCRRCREAAQATSVLMNAANSNII